MVLTTSTLQRFIRDRDTELATFEGRVRDTEDALKVDPTNKLYRLLFEYTAACRAIRKERWNATQQLKDLE